MELYIVLQNLLSRQRSSYNNLVTSSKLWKAATKAHIHTFLVNVFVKSCCRNESYSSVTTTEMSSVYCCWIKSEIKKKKTGNSCVIVMFSCRNSFSNPSRMRLLAYVVFAIERTHFMLSGTSLGRRRLADNTIDVQWKCALHTVSMVDTEPKKSTSRRNMLKHNIFDSVCVQM